MRYAITLRSGVQLVGIDERGTEDLLAGATWDEGDELPRGWVWLAEHYVKADEIAAITLEGP